jgi:fucose permease
MSDPIPHGRRTVAVAWAGFLLIGWSGVLLPTLVRQVEAEFGVDDAGLGIVYLTSSLGYAFASFAGGVVTEWIGRRGVLVAAALLVAVGLALESAATTWLLFVAGAPLVGMGSGAIDGGMNGLLLDVAEEGRGRALNLLHLFFSIGAFVSPVVVGRLVAAGTDWRLVLLVTAVATVPIAAAVRLVPMPSGRRRVVAPERSASGSVPGTAARAGRWPLVLLAVAIACYVASEIGVSNWIVRFLERADLGTATSALGGFWAGLAVGRIVASRIADRLPHALLTTGASLIAAIAILVAVLSPTIELSIVAFAVAGFTFGPVFPMIIAIGGDLYPDRLAATAGTLTGSAVVGAILYPPLVGLMSASVGIGTGMLGAAALSVVSAMVVLAATRRAA